MSLSPSVQTEARAPHDVSDAARRLARLTGRRARVGAAGLSLLGVASWGYSIHQIHPYQTGDAGLVTGLPVLWWVGLVLVTGALAVQLIDREPKRVPILVSILSLAVVLHGTLPASESVPRFGAAYYIAGFTNYVGHTGRTLPHLDARMSWFGLFAGAGMTSQAMQVSAIWFLRWAPLFFELCYLFPVKALANIALRTGRARWAALALFLAGNWIDQDYFSPQAVGLMMFLTITLIAVRSFATRGETPWPVNVIVRSSAFRTAGSVVVRALRLPYGATPSEVPAEPTSPATRAALTLAVLFLGTVLTVSHQASPVALCIVMFMLAIFGRTKLKTVWLFFGFVVFAWLSFAGIDYWRGHLTKVFGSVGQVGSTVSVSVTGRAVTTGFGRSLVEAGRIGSALVIWGGGALGALFLWKRGRSLWTVGILAIAPVIIAGVVSYGGEIALRILLFSLVPLAVLAAGLIDERRLRFGSVALFGSVLVLLIAMFPIDRFGNESFEAYSPSDFASSTWIHTHVPMGSHILLFSRNVPLDYTDVGDYHFTDLGLEVEYPAAYLEAIFPRDASYIYLTHSQYEEATVYLGLPANWQQVFETNLARLSFVHLVFSNSSSRVYYLAPHPRGLPLINPFSPKGQHHATAPTPHTSVPPGSKVHSPPPTINFHLPKPTPPTTVRRPPPTTVPKKPHATTTTSGPTTTTTTVPKTATT